MKDFVVDWIRHFYEYGPAGFDRSSYDAHAIYWATIMTLLLIIGSILMWYFAKSVMLRVLHMAVDRSKVTWDDHLLRNKVFRSLAQLVPLMFLEYFLSIAFYRYPTMEAYWSRIVGVLMIFSILVSINRTANALRDIVQEKELYKDKPIQSYFQVVKIISSGILIILMLSILTNRTPVFFLTSLGAMTAILVLVFKDTILGFVGSVQMATNDLIRIGDWITMDKFGADGIVTEINLATVKVQNFDKTITTIPTYSFISDSFKNWRGMQESDGRRIKRAVHIQIDSIGFASAELIEKLRKIRILKDFVEERQQEIEDYNATHGFVEEEALINARRQTNIGLFRRYIEYYLHHNPQINQNMTAMVRQLASSETGIPLEIYCFTKTKVWDQYEVAMADIFDHIFAIAHFFELRIFESPSGNDFKRLSDRDPGHRA
jgi:miniconductance mechanosensitive channel